MKMAKKKLFENKKLLEKVLLAVGLKMARSKKHSETTRYPDSGKTVVKTLKCIRIEDAADEDAEPVHFIDKDFGDIPFRFFDGESFFTDEDEIVEKLGRTREFMHWQVPNNNFTVWQNPFFRCSSLEEMLVNIDLLGLRKKEQLACVSKDVWSFA